MFGLVGWLAVVSFHWIDLCYQHSDQKVGGPRDAISRYRGFSPPQRMMLTAAQFFILDLT